MPPKKAAGGKGKVNADAVQEEPAKKAATMPKAGGKGKAKADTAVEGGGAKKKAKTGPMASGTASGQHPIDTSGVLQVFFCCSSSSLFSSSAI